MKSMVITQFGDTHVFTAHTLPKPRVKPGYVLIKVMATSINPLDCKLRKGMMPDLIKSFPATLHGDVAGVIEEIGEGVHDFSVGDEVYGCVGGFLDMGGGLDEYVAADANLIAHKPKTLSLIESAALPLVSLTAFEGLVTYAQVEKGQTVLVHGGTGGVGHIAIQLAKYLGARVSATSSSSPKLDMIKQLGADFAIHYKEMDVKTYVTKYTHGLGFDVVFDTVGGDNLPQCFEAASLYGQVLSINARGHYDLTPAFLKGLTIHTILQPLPLITGKNRVHYQTILTKMAELVDQGLIKPLIDEKIFAIDDVAAAHAYFESGDAIGKIVLSRTV